MMSTIKSPHKKEINYTSFTESLFGLMSKHNRVILDQNLEGLHLIHRDKNKLYLYPGYDSSIKLKDIEYVFNNYPDYKKLYLAYLPDVNWQELLIEEPLLKKNSKSNSTNLISEFSKDYFDLSGATHREIRESRNKFNKKIRLVNLSKIEDFEQYCIYKSYIMDLLKTWDQTSGEKYGIQRHSGYDRSFFEKHFWPNKKDYFVNCFFNEEKLVGYSVICLNPIINETTKEPYYCYIIRKSLIDERNVCLYVDYKSIELFANENNLIGKQFNVHWGASSGSLLKYKKKFPVKNESKTWFITLNYPKKENEENV